MHAFEEGCTGRLDELLHRLRDDVGLSAPQAELFLREATQELAASYRWYEQDSSVRSTPAARDILAAIPGDRLAIRVGVSSQTAWDGLRTLIPSLLTATDSSGEG